MEPMSWPGLPRAIQSQNQKMEFVFWMAASEGGHNNKGIPNNFDML